MINKIIGEIENNLTHYRKTGLDVNPVFAPTQHQIIELIDLYSMDRFRDNSYDELGFLKPFYNVTDTPLQVAANFMDLDVKDIELVAEEGQSYYPVWIMEEDLKLWMKDNKNCYADGRWMDFGLFLNAMIYGFPKYGHIVLKKSEDKIYLMPLQNLYVEPSAESLTNAKYIIEKHDYSPYELRMKNWDNVEEAIKKCEVEGHIFVYEFFGQVDGTDDNYFIVATQPHKWTQQNIHAKDLMGNIGTGVLLHSDKLEKMPYKELPFEKVTGRWLGKGQIEKLFHPQIYQNRIAEYKAKGAHWTSKHIYQSRDPDVEKNLATEVKDGRILKITSEITPIGVEERNLHFYRDEEARYDQLVDKRSFSWDTMRGERPPSGLTLGQSVLQSRAAGGFFQRKQEEIGLFLKDVMYDWIFPSFKKDRKRNHRLMLRNFNEERLAQIKNLKTEKRFKEEVFKIIAKSGRYPNSQEQQIIKGIAKEQVNREKDIIIPESFYNDVRAKIKIVITGEQIDLASRITTLQTVLVMISQNPTILQDPNTKKIFMELLDKAGISPTRFESETSNFESSIGQMEEPRAQRGGSVARLPQIGTPQTAPTEATL